ncbi:MAG: hypothetical protein JW759_08445 [Candidatus Coatesbacteria bacterium]|nr:hypothetical protein [Candidatus Coatesbacteria bacterium]
MMLLTYALLFLFDLVLLALILLVFAEKRRARKDFSKLLDSESGVIELTRSMEQLIDEYKRVASRIQDDTSAKRDELMHTIQRADRLLMELVRRSDRFELAVESCEITSKKPPAMEPEGTASAEPMRGIPPSRVAAAQRQTVVRTPVELKRPIAGAEGEAWGQAPPPSDPRKPRAQRAQVESVGSRPESPQQASASETRISPAVAEDTHKEGPSTAVLKKTSAPPIRTSVEQADNERPESGEAAVEDKEMRRTKKLVMDLSRQGLDVETIARSLRIPIGQVKLILDVQKSKTG